MIKQMNKEEQKFWFTFLGEKNFSDEPKEQPCWQTPISKGFTNNSQKSYIELLKKIAEKYQ